jgi:hypothetical protein
MKLKHPHLVVVGRIPDQENVFEVFTNLTAEQAVKAFEKKLVAEHIADYCETREQKQEVKEQGVYVDAVFTSDTPIGIECF